MRVKKLVILIFIVLIYSSGLFSQTISTPNIGLKSHETLEIKKIDIGSDKTVIYLSIENRIEGGAFCADKNIYILDPKGKKLIIKSSSGIPVCPDSYKFKHIGEKLDFVLVFPPIFKGTRWIDLIEDCNDNCFSMYGIVIDNKLNQALEDAFRSAENNEPAKSLASFLKIAGSPDFKNDGASGLIYLNIVKLAKETGSTAKAAEWYNKLKTSSVPRASLYIKNLNDQGISY